MSPLLILAFDLSVSDGSLLEGGQTGQWGWGDPGAGPVGLGSCWGTNPDGPYLHDTIDTLEIPLGDLSGISRPILTMRHWYEIAAGDQGVLEIHDGTGWSVLDPVFGYPDPAGFTGTSGAYVVHAWDLSGRGIAPRVRLSFRSDPVSALAGWYVQELNLWDGDIIPPSITPLVTPTDTQDLSGPYPAELEIVDDVGVSSASLSWQTDTEGPISVPMVRLADDRWQGDIPAQPPDTIVRWSIVAEDGSQQTRWPELGDAQFRVFLAAPTQLTGPSLSHTLSQRIELSWTPPDSPHPVRGYEVFQEGAPEPLVVEAPSVGIPLETTDSQIFDVRAIYDAGTGDTSPPLSLQVEVPQLDLLEPSFGYQGERRYVQLSGQSLYLLQEISGLQLGSGVTILSFDVADAHSATALIEIDADAAVGPRDVELTSTGGSLSFADRFELLAGDDAPQIQQIVPDVLDQGEEIDVEIEATVPYAATPTITGGEDLVISGSIEVQGSIVRFGLAASTRSRLGRHTLVIDDGARRFLVDIEVEEYVVPPARRCAVAPAGGLGLLGCCFVAGLARRKKPFRSSRHTRD